MTHVLRYIHPFSGEPKCGVVSEKCKFPFEFDGNSQTSCIEFSRFGGEQVPGPVNDEGDDPYCKQTQGAGRGKFESWSWGLCNQACLSDDGCELL